MTTATASRRAFAFSPSGTIHHIVEGVTDEALTIARGTRFTARCGARVALANDLPRPDAKALPAGTCRRCASSLGRKVQLNTTDVIITHRDGRVGRETHTEHAAWKLTTTYNRTAFDAGVIDVVVEWDDNNRVDGNA